MFKQEYIDQINEEIINLQKETKSLFIDGSEDEIMLRVERARKAYLYLKEQATKVAKTRKLKQVREYAESHAAPKLGLAQTPPKSKGKKPKTKDEKLTASLANLGLDTGDFLKRLKEK